MTGRLRGAALWLLALALVGGVLAVQLARGGGSFEPLHTADPCAARAVSSTSTGLDGLTEELVLLGLDGASCRLHESREALTLELARSRTPSDAEVDALRAGLRAAVRRLDEEGRLPKASSLVDEALDDADLNGFLEAAIRALPDSVVDAALKTDDVLTRTVDDLDVRSVLSDLDDQHSLQAQVEAAVTQAVRQALVDRLRSLF